MLVQALLGGPISGLLVAISYESAATSSLASSEEGIQLRDISQKRLKEVSEEEWKFIKKRTGKKGKHTWKRPQWALSRSSAVSGLLTWGFIYWYTSGVLCSFSHDSSLRVLCSFFHDSVS